HRHVHESSLDLIRTIASACIAAHADLSIDVRLSCAWSRMLILPALAQLTREERWRNYARARFEQVYTDSADGWDLRVARNWPDRDRLAVAWPRALREELSAHANVRSARVGALEYLGVLLAQMPNFSGCLAHIEAGGAGLLLLYEGCLRRVRWCRFENDDGLAATVSAEWAGVQATQTGEASEAALALAAAAGQLEVDAARTIERLASNLGISRTVCLPDWA
ncbi:MAG TPA: hypothetical protein VED85_00890, partial [Burkholderiaceae bacterium]|nr:hypothetical protein [Burkholderiaceae bacterium]